jgi:hypothetical protein
MIGWSTRRSGIACGSGGSLALQVPLVLEPVADVDDRVMKRMMMGSQIATITGTPPSSLPGEGRDPDPASITGIPPHSWSAALQPHRRLPTITFVLLILPPTNGNQL